LERTDLYIGDMSSIGYDFLTFQRPMVFLRKEKTEPTLLMKAGVQLTLEEIPQLFSRIAPPPKHNLVEYAFESAENWSQKLKTYL
jgi:CDP-glycerol glycerophosphotransferase (TagB/SpsB family)